MIGKIFREYLLLYLFAIGLLILMVSCIIADSDRFSGLASILFPLGVSLVATAVVVCLVTLLRSSCASIALSGKKQKMQKT